MARLRKDLVYAKVRALVKMSGQGLISLAAMCPYCGNADTEPGQLISLGLEFEHCVQPVLCLFCGQRWWNHHAHAVDHYYGITSSVEDYLSGLIRLMPPEEVGRDQDA